jgi:hypothetical protein
MAIKRKGEKAKQGLPTKLVELTERAATYTTTAAFFKDRYDATKEEIEAYLEDPNCPVTVSVGTGGGVKVDGIGGYSFSQPTRMDNREAVAVIVAALKDGSLQPDALTEIISTVSVPGMEKSLPKETIEGTYKKSDKVVITLRTASEFKADVIARLEKTVSATEKPVAEVTVVQPGSAARDEAFDADQATV